MRKFKQLGFSEYSDVSLYRAGSMERIHVDLYSNGKYNLFARIIEENARYVKQDGRFMILNKDDDIIMDISVDNIVDAMAKSYDNMCQEILFSIDNVRYRLLIYGGKELDVICA